MTGEHLHQGSIDTISLADGTSIQQHYDVFGAPEEAGSVVRSGYTGHQHDRDIGFIDMRGRMYDTLAGQFASADPIIQDPFWSQGFNRYAYVFNDPINNVDPSGFEATLLGQTTLLGQYYPSDVPAAFSGGGVYDGAPGPFGGSGLGTAVGATAGAVNLGLDGLNWSNLPMFHSTPGSTSHTTLGNAASSTTQATQGPGSARTQNNANGRPTAAPGPGRNLGVLPDSELCKKAGWGCGDAWSALDLVPMAGAVVEGAEATGRVLINLLRSALAKEVFKTLPEWVKTGGALVRHAENLQRVGQRVTKEVADDLVKAARRFDVKVRLDPPHPNTKWNMPHLNIGAEGQAHVPVPDGYNLPL